MGTFSEAICKHRILFPCIQHLAWLPQGRPQRKPKCGKKIAIFGLTHRLKHRITRKTIEDRYRYMLRGVWQALDCLSIYATYCVIVAGASPGETKMWAAVRENVDSRGLSAIAELLVVARQHTHAWYWYSNSVRPSACLSVCLPVTFRYAVKTP